MLVALFLATVAAASCTPNPTNGPPVNPSHTPCPLPFTRVGEFEEESSVVIPGSIPATTSALLRDPQGRTFVVQSGAIGDFGDEETVGPLRLTDGSIGYLFEVGPTHWGMNWQGDGECRQVSAFAKGLGRGEFIDHMRLAGIVAGKDRDTPQANR